MEEKWKLKLTSAKVEVEAEAELGKKGDTQALKSKEKNFFLEFVSKPWFIILCVRNMTNVCGGNI